ncbi:unnamed protein product [Pieris macdunnoughi]|uniref:Complex I assembly factor TIMMDC1, mitochondrial n=1 Tax=Pieris macdunnoughi TaxID=345717 RepID=A0A821N1Q4_9NEOP|nr:unnamed protein product [Pieris macdunnoughi]
MFRILNKKILFGTTLRLTPAAIIPFFNTPNKNDIDNLKTNPKDGPITGWERVRQMFTVNEDDVISIELHNVIQASLFGAFVGVCYGGFLKSKDAYISFLENNQATIFKSTFEAKRKLQDYVTIAFAKGAVRWGWRLFIFTGMYTLIATTISIYRDKNSVLEYVVAGAVTGSLYKVNLGLAATLVGAGLGAALSLIAGIVIIGILKISGVSMADIRRSLYGLKEMREEQYNQGVEKHAKEKHDNLTKHHDQLVESKGKTKVDEL